MNHKLILLLVCLFMTNVLAAQQTAKYWITFKDKTDSPYSINKPYEFLSPRAIERRTKQGIAIEENDLPVNPQYLQRVQAQGAIIHNTSKWLNATTVIADSISLERIEQLPFVDSIAYVGAYRDNQIKLKTGKKEKDTWQNYKKMQNRYGKGAHQIKMINGHQLHDLGYQGKGVMVGILDGGFTNVDIMPFFDSMRMEGRLLPGWDFVGNDAYAYESSNHGSNVLSVMGSNLPGLFIGSAPAATFVCIKTEDSGSEYVVEECNWVAGAEFADSLGVDVINSSLGYSAFNDKAMNYKHSDLDGKTARASIAADIAFSKGMIVVNSAGNSGDGWWKYIGVPSDGNDVLAIGATDAEGNRASFSSKGVPADPRIKPNVSAMGAGITVASIYGYVTYSSNGTSFASPLVAGAIASLWQAFPNKSNREITNAVEQSASQSDAPDKSLGYGIPDFYKAYQLLKAESTAETMETEKSIKVFPNPFKNSFDVLLSAGKEALVEVQVFDLLGRLIYLKSFSVQSFKANQLNIQLNPNTPAGYFFLNLKMGEKYFQAKLTKEP